MKCTPFAFFFPLSPSLIRRSRLYTSHVVGFLKVPPSSNLWSPSPGVSRACHATLYPWSTLPARHSLAGGWLPPCLGTRSDRDTRPGFRAFLIPSRMNEIAVSIAISAAPRWFLPIQRQLVFPHRLTNLASSAPSQKAKDDLHLRRRRPDEKEKSKALTHTPCSHPSVSHPFGQINHPPLWGRCMRLPARLEPLAVPVRESLHRSLFFFGPSLVRVPSCGCFVIIFIFVILARNSHWPS